MTEPYVRPCACGTCDFCRRWASDPAWRRSRVAAPRPGRAGYGDAVAWLTGKLGVEPCGGCKERRDKLNRLPTPGELWRKLWRRHG